MTTLTTAPGAAADDEFGTSVAIFKKVVVVGSFHGEAAYVFRGSNYDYSVTLAAADGEKGFGRAVAVDGDKVVVGAPAGEAAYVFTVAGTGWDTDTPDYAYTKLTATDATAGDEFGSSVAVRGDAVMVGAHGSQSAYAYQTTDGWDTHVETKLTADDAAAGEEFGHSVAIDGDTVVV